MALANEVFGQEMANTGSPVPSNTPTAKVMAASGGSAVGGALGTIITWIIVSNNLIGPPPIPEDVHTAITAVITAGCGALVALLSGYFTRPQPNMAVIYDQKRRPRIARHVA